MTTATANAFGLALWLLLCAGAPKAHAGDTVRGAELYRRHCTACHGASGRPHLPTAPDFRRPTSMLKPDLVLMDGIKRGKGAMPAYDGILREREILDVVAYLRTLK